MALAQSFIVQQGIALNFAIVAISFCLWIVAPIFVFIIRISRVTSFIRAIVVYINYTQNKRRIRSYHCRQVLKLLVDLWKCYSTSIRYREVIQWNACLICIITFVNLLTIAYTSIVITIATFKLQIVSKCKSWCYAIAYFCTFSYRWCK